MSRVSESRDLFPGALEMMILRTLALRPMHGYALVKRIQTASSDLLQIEEGSLYPALQRLLKARFVMAGWALFNLTNRQALYNFLSTFSGTHFVTPRAYQVQVGVAF